MPNLRSQMLRIASELPQGDPTRRKLLAAVKQARLGPSDPLERALWEGSPAKADVTEWDQSPPPRGVRLDVRVGPDDELSWKARGQTIREVLEWAATIVQRKGRQVRETESGPKWDCDTRGGLWVGGNWFQLDQFGRWHEC